MIAGENISLAPRLRCKPCNPATETTVILLSLEVDVYNLVVGLAISVVVLQKGDVGQKLGHRTLTIGSRRPTPRMPMFLGFLGTSLSVEGVVW